MPLDAGRIQKELKARPWNTHAVAYLDPAPAWLSPSLRGALIRGLVGLTAGDREG